MLLAGPKSHSHKSVSERVEMIWSFACTVRGVRLIVDRRIQRQGWQTVLKRSFSVKSSLTTVNSQDLLVTMSEQNYA